MYLYINKDVTNKVDKKRKKRKLRKIKLTELIELISIKDFVSPPASALRDSLRSQRTLHTFANRTFQPLNQNLQKSAINPPTFN